MVKLSNADRTKYYRLKRNLHNLTSELRQLYYLLPIKEFCELPEFSQIQCNGKPHRFILDDGTTTNKVPRNYQITKQFLSNNFRYDNGDLYYGGKLVESLQTTGYRYIGIGGKNYLAHRIIWEIHNGPIPKGMVIDHIDGCRTNNKIENLRCITRQQNQWNTGTSRGNILGIKYIGIVTSKGRQYYRLQFHSPFSHIKTFPPTDEGLASAIAYRDEWVKTHHGEAGNVESYDGEADTGERYIFWSDPDHKYYFVNVQNKTRICKTMDEAKEARDKFMSEVI